MRDESGLAQAEYAMTYEEIARQLGVTRQAVEQTCKRGLLKLSRDSLRVAVLMELASEYQRLRARRAPLEPA